MLLRNTFRKNYLFYGFYSKNVEFLEYCSVNQLVMGRKIFRIRAEDFPPLHGCVIKIDFAVFVPVFVLGGKYSGFGRKIFRPYKRV